MVIKTKRKNLPKSLKIIPNRVYTKVHTHTEKLLLSFQFYYYSILIFGPRQTLA